MKKNIALFVTLLLASASPAAEINPLPIGSALPAATLKTANGKDFDLQKEAARQPLVIIFYRGGWCPYCNTHLGQLQTIDPALRKLGYKIVAISPDLPAHAAATLEKKKLSYTLLSDASMKTAEAFGIAFTLEKPMLQKLASYNIDVEAASGQTHHKLPVPAVFLVGTDGLIDFVHADENYKKRLAPEKLLAAARAAKAQ